MNETEGVLIHPQALVENCSIGRKSMIWAFSHILPGAVIGRNCNIGDHCFIEGKVSIGNDVVIKNGVSIWDGVVLEDKVFIGPNTAFTNDAIPRAKVFQDKYENILVKEGASIGANSTLIAPLCIGRYALIGAGSVLTRDVPDFGLFYGNPARLEGFVCFCGSKLSVDIEKDGSLRCSCGQSFNKKGFLVSEK